MRLQPVIVPYRYDERETGLGLGPGALLAAGLVERLSASGLQVLPPVDVELANQEREKGPIEINVGRLGAHIAAPVAAARRAGAGALVLAGDCTAAVGIVAGLQQADGADAAVGVVWLDAHGDFNTPDTSISGILAGMPVAILAGFGSPLWRGAAGLARPLPTERILLSGVRDLDDEEAALLRTTEVQIVTTAQVRAQRQLQSAINRLTAACSLFYLHLDLDVLDPRLVPSTSTPAANGLEIAEVAQAMRQVLATGKVAAVGITSLNPGAGTRGERSVRNTLALLEQALPGWEQAPDPPAAHGA